MLKKRQQIDNSFFYDLPLKRRIKLIIVRDHWVYLRKYFYLLRKAESYEKKSGIICKLLSLIYTRRKNTLGVKLGLYIPLFSTQRGITIWHNGVIVINGDARVGKGCVFHGDNCIGNNGKTLDAPIIGENVEIGVGASIIGNVYIADNVRIGAGAVVTKSCYTKGATLVGVPAKITSNTKSKA